MKLRLFFNLITIGCFIWLMLYAELALYLVKVSYGQINLLLNTEKISEVLNSDKTSKEEKKKILLIEEIKKYSVDSLGYKPTKNFTTYFNQHNQPILWIVTACKPFSFDAYTWKFPIVGKVSYKGFFNRNGAQKEFLKIYAQGYDADISEVSAWSTLGWLPDPILSSMLVKSKGRMANLFFHELFHATYYAPSSVDVNENLANFIARKATLKFLQNDTAELTKFLKTLQDDSIYNSFVFKGYQTLKTLYSSTEKLDDHQRLKEKENALVKIYTASFHLKLNYPKRFKDYSKQILISKNSFFVDAHRYDGLSDSLELVFNKKYGGNLKKMIEDLKK
ncbi:MAG TPA: aminopeptidase [Bacteroidia bacterium]|jgi:predicted aminopeptidase|nr:aminopeptidase [Bacteroidia bacterium]